MTEITQSDCNVAEYIAGDRARDLDYQVVARHRQQAAAEERAKIVAWLRGFATNYADDLADILEAGEHEDFTHPDNISKK